MLSSIRRFCAAAAFVAAALDANAASAQTPDDDPDRQPISAFAVDVRGAFANYPTDPTIATFLGLTQDNIVKRSFGVVIGAHVYPIRKRVTLGFGADLLLSRGNRSIQVADEDDEDELIDGPTVSASLSAFSPQLSLNFGRRSGWSYVSAGIGWMKFDTKVVDAGDAVTSPPTPTTPTRPRATSEAPRTRTINYGGGARWFAKDHLAFCFDLRFHAVSPEPATATRPALARKRLVVASVGVSFR